VARRPARARLDAELVRRGLASSRAQAQQLIADGRVTVAGSPAAKAAALVAPGDALAVRAGDDPGWASRGAHKLAGALDALGVAVEGRHCLDAGASTGGFTDVLLRRGAARVLAVDVGYGQLDWRLRTDPRVEVHERTNVRHLTAGDLPPSDLVVADLSFISLRLVLPALRALATPDADLVLLVKPQFEAGPERVGKGGVVRDPAVWRAALEDVVAAAADLGLGLAGACVSPLPGPAGNVEFFVHLAEGAPSHGHALDAAVEDGIRLAHR
jgi:23S rRNA (cytidine1920-2'-O)/16S rRNA (cytidine1409-2'-O)-methyltransferase